jgi:glycosyltransferase involved in cell wall biosynthesis
VTTPADRRPKALFLTTIDTFFLSHRRPLAEAVRDAGFEVVVAAIDSGASADIRSLRMRFVPLNLQRESVSPWREAATVLEIARLYVRERPDLVHHSSIKPMIYGSLVARALRIPAFVNTVSGLGYALTETTHPSLERRLLRAAALGGYRAALRSSRSRCIFQNRDQMRSFIEAGLCRASESVLIVGAGVDTDRFRPSPLPNGTPLVVLPARMLTDKGVVEMVTAARALKHEGVAARFALVGGEDPGNRAAIPGDQLRAWVDEGVVEWWGHRRDMPEVFSQSHLVVLPSYAEGMPLALAEAAAAGRACITTDVPGCREAVVDGETGFLVPVRDAAALADAIRRALAEPANLARMGQCGRQHALDKLSRERVIRETFAVFRELGVRSGRGQELGARA